MERGGEGGERKGEEGVKEGTGDGLGRRLEPWTQREGEQRRE